MGTSKISLADKLKDVQFRETLLAKHPNSKHIRTYFLSGRHAKPDLACWSIGCRVHLATQLDSNVAGRRLSTSSLQINDSELQILSPSTETHPFCFCFACNRSFHVKCLGLNLQTFVKRPAPFLCNDCRDNRGNDYAVAYYLGNDWERGIDARRLDCLNPDSVNADPSLALEQLTDTEFDESDRQAFVNIADKVNDSFGSEPNDDLKKQQAEMQKLAKIHANYVRSTELSMEEMNDTIHNLRTELMKVQIDQITSKAQRSASVSFTKPVGNSTINNRPSNILTAETLLRRSYINNPANVQRVRQPSNNQSTNRIDLTNNRQSIDNLINDPNISLSEKVLLTSTQAQLESSNAQKAVSNAMTLELRRKALPKITKYKGDYKNWIKFKKEVQRYREIGCFEDEVVKMYVLGALEGVALKRIQDMIDVSTLDEIMTILETSFGHSPSIIKACEDDILRFKLKGDLMRNDVVQINSLIQTYLTACRYANVQNLNSNMFANHILNQLSGVHKLFFRQHYKRERPHEVTQVADLDVMFTFLEGIAEDLEVRAEERDEKRSKNPQVNTISSNLSASNNYATSEKSRNDNFKFEIRDKSSALYLGYDMNLVKSLTKKCEVCKNSNHFTLECYKFKAMNPKQRSELINTKQLCKNCLLTCEHQANSCNLKPGCGFKSGVNRCTQKHHILLHDATNNQNRRFRNNSHRRSNTNRNANRAQELLNNTHSSSNQAVTLESRQSETSQSNSQPTSANFISNVRASNADYQVTPRQTNVILQSDRTVKVFRHYIYGPKLEHIGYSIGDSGAEITLMREDLRKTLGIEGTPTSVDMQWADGTIKRVPAMKIKIELKGLEHDSEVITLDNCFAIDNLELPARSLDIDKLKRQFPYLQGVNFDSYVNISPVLLLGSPHASCFEAIAPIIEAGEGKPIAIKSKLGWSIFGGEPENYSDTPCSVQSVTLNRIESNEKDSTENSMKHEKPENTNEQSKEQLEYFSSIENFGNHPHTTYLTEDEKKTNEFIEKGKRQGSQQETLQREKVAIRRYSRYSEERARDYKREREKHRRRMGDQFPPRRKRNSHSRSRRISQQIQNNFPQTNNNNSNNTTQRRVSIDKYEEINKIHCVVSDSATVLLHRSDLELLATPNGYYNQTIHNANQLHRDIADEFASMNNQQTGSEPVITVTTTDSSRIVKRRVPVETMEGRIKLERLTPSVENESEDAISIGDDYAELE